VGSFITHTGFDGLSGNGRASGAGTHFLGQFVDSGAVATGLAQIISPLAGNLFSLVLLNASIVGAAAVTLSTSYAIGDVFKMKHSLHRSWKDAKGFYMIYAAIVLIAAGIVLIPNAPLGLMTTLVQVLAGVLLPSATVFLVLLCNDKAILGPWVNKAWQNILSSIIVGVLVMLSLILASTTLFPTWDTWLLVKILASALVLGLLITSFIQLRLRGKDSKEPEIKLDPLTWRMPPLSELPKVVSSKTRSIGMLTLRAYLIIAVVLLVVKAIQLATGK
jgi:hypothetical protein